MVRLRNQHDDQQQLNTCPDHGYPKCPSPTSILVDEPADKRSYLRAGWYRLAHVYLLLLNMGVFISVWRGTPSMMDIGSTNPNRGCNSLMPESGPAVRRKRIAYIPKERTCRIDQHWCYRDTSAYGEPIFTVFIIIWLTRKLGFGEQIYAKSASIHPQQPR